MAKVKYGVLNPPTRSGTPTDSEWNRFDIAGVGTIYSSSERRGAFLEALQMLRPSHIDLSSLFDDYDGTDLIAKDWDRLGHMLPGNIPAQWRKERQIATVFFVAKGWFVDVLAVDTLTMLRKNLLDWAPNSGNSYENLDVSHLTSADRQLTCSAAKWIREQVLDDGSYPSGLVYSSKFGTDISCNSVWLEPTDPSGWKVDGVVIASEHQEILASDPDLIWAANVLKIVVH